jgi:hypothetical protein
MGDEGCSHLTKVKWNLRKVNLCNKYLNQAIVKSENRELGNYCNLIGII